VRANDPGVTRLDLSMMGLQDEHAALVADALRGNTHVTEVDMGFNDALTDAGAQAVLAVLPECAVRKVELKYAKGVSDEVKRAVARACVELVLAPVRANDAGVTELDLSMMGLQDEHAALVADALRSMDVGAYPHCSNAHAYLVRGGQVIFNGKDDIVTEIGKFL
jgi:hypothetical protein